MTYESYLTWRNEPMPLAPELSIIIPAYNEQNRIIPTIGSIAAHMAKRTMTYEIIVSDDGSSDATVATVRSLGLRNVRVLAHAQNRGKGAAVRSAIAEAQGERILFTDADLSTPIQELDQLLVALDDHGRDIAIGSRAAGDAEEHDRSALRRLLSWGSRRLMRMGLGLDIADTQCGFKLFTRDAAKSVFAVARTDGFAFDAEVLYAATRQGLSIAEVPVQWFDAPGSKVDPVKAVREFLTTVVRIRGRDLRGTYRVVRTDPRPVVGVVTALPPSTATLGEYGDHLVKSLASKADLADVVAFVDDRDGVPEAQEGYTVEPAWTFDSPLSLLRIVRSVKRSNVDAVVFNTHFTSFGTNKIAAGLGLLTPAVLRRLGVPTIVLLHNLVETVDLDAAGYSRGKLIDGLMRRIGRVLTKAILQATWVVTTMPRYVDILRNDYGAANVSLTPHGAFELPKVLTLDPPDGRRRVLAFGKFGTYKKVDELIAAFRLMQEQGYGDVELVIGGTDTATTPGYLASVEAACADLDNVRFTGYVAEDDVATLFTSASVVVFPYTATTGSSGPLHQAGSYARAVAAPQIGDLLDLIDEEGYVAEAFQPGDHVSLADAIRRLLDDDAARHDQAKQNQIAAAGVPLDLVADWYVDRVQSLVG